MAPGGTSGEGRPRWRPPTGGLPPRKNQIGSEAFLDLLENRHRILLPLLRHICQVLVETQVRFTHVALGDARTRMAAQLLDLAERYGTPAAKGITLDLPLRRAELASLVGLSPETAMRLLSQFQREGLLEVQGRRLTLKAPERLRALL